MTLRYISHRQSMARSILPHWPSFLLIATPYSGKLPLRRYSPFGSWLVGFMYCLLSWGLIPATQAQYFGWAKHMGGTDNDIGRSVALDAAGNVYTTGYFKQTVDFDPGPTQVNLTSAGETDIFLCKFDPAGNLLWAKAIGSTNNDLSNGVAVDGAGHVYITGYFLGTVDFDPGPGQTTLTSVGNADLFVSKFDGSGNLLWAKAMGGDGGEIGNAITVDGVGNVYTTGFFFGTADFDPGPASYPLTSVGGQYDIFISKLDASGGFQWAKVMGGSQDDFGTSVTVDGSGSVYTTGNFADIADFDPGPGEINLTSAGNADLFLSKLDATGNLVWAKSLGGVGEDAGLSVTVDGSGNVYMTGDFRGTVDFDPGAGQLSLTSIGYIDQFVGKFDGSGNLLWAKSVGGTLSVIGRAIHVDAAGSVYTTGNFSGTADFDPGLGVTNLSTAGLDDIFVSKFDPAGNLLWAKAMGGALSDVGNAVAVDGAGSVYTTGFFYSAADFDPSGEAYTLTPVGLSDIFVSKLTPLSPLQLTASVSPNPVCVGSPTLLSVSVSGSTQPYSYTWTAPPGVTLSATSTTVVSATLTQTGEQTFTVSAAGYAGPVSSTTVSVTVNAVPIATIAAAPSATLSCAQPSLTLTANEGGAYFFSGSGLVTASGNTAVVNVAGIYSVTVTNTANGCFSTTSIAISNNSTLNAASLQATASPANQPISVTATGCEAGIVSWLPLGGSGTANGNIYTFSAPGNYTLSATCSVGSCTSPQSTPVVLQILPGGFAITSVSIVNCQLVNVAKGQYSVQFTPLYTGQNANPISFSVVNELAPTFQSAPYVLTLYNDNPTITLVANQTGNPEARYLYNWLASCQTGSDPNQAPTTSGIPSQSILQGQAYQLQLTNYFTDPDGQPLTFTAQNLPAGLSVNGSLLSGTPSMTGVNSVTITAIDPGGLQVSTNFTLTVTPGPVQPSGFGIVGVSLVSCGMLSPAQRALTFTPQYSGVNGSPISFSVVNEMIPTTQPGPYTLNLYTDNPVITLRAQQGNSSAVYTYNWLVFCNLSGRVGVAEAGTGLQVRVLGNPVESQTLEVEISGAEGQRVSLELVDLKGHRFQQKQLERVGGMERVKLAVGSLPEVFLLQVNTATQRQVIRVVKP
ncbi:hypothetical protein IC229_35045 [Spirosoma sp. BT702]|uniref:PKD domain-containing protein n=1 Tax=Spirosoma profusum TaxID=2771354 RepID=A0A927AWR7_9BACT|nr:putative Ig domain-containing protein [Spirosoma profusum]MBD2705868.1 hypothetical protein [Spirosoma profusum]